MFIPTPATSFLSILRLWKRIVAAFLIGIVLSLLALTAANYSGAFKTAAFLVSIATIIALFIQVVLAIYLSVAIRMRCKESHNYLLKAGKDSDAVIQSVKFFLNAYNSIFPYVIEVEAELMSSEKIHFVDSVWFKGSPPRAGDRVQVICDAQNLSLCVMKNLHS